jgi:hypothetical protein
MLGLEVVKIRLLPACLALGVAFLGGVGCASPTLPLPPPSVEQGGKVHLTSVRGAEPNAIIVIYNLNPALPLDQRVSGAQADGVGSWDADTIASTGDVLDITQEFGSTRSPPITVQIP